MCTYCGFKFCNDHKPTEAHQCIKTRYSEYIRQSNTKEVPNMATGNFRVVCDMCGFTTSKGVPIEYAGEELIQHTQIVGCIDKIFLEEVKEPMKTDSVPSPDNKDNQEKINLEQINQLKNQNVIQSTSIVDQIIKLSELKEKGVISEEEFSNIKKELIKKLR